MFENYRKFETTFAGRPVIVETGKTCALSNGSCWVHYGETVVMANVTASAKPREGVDFFPLSVDYEERMYAVGRIPGSFTTREGKPSEKAILTSRMVDRPIRPLFPKDMRNDVSVVMTVLAVDPDCSPEITGMLAASIAIAISDIPWNGPIAGISVGLCDGQIVLNPTLEQREKGITLDFIRTQIKCGLNGISKDDITKVIIAYEPIWAIGTGKTATSAEAEEVCGAIRNVLAEMYDTDTAEKIRIQYGGSVNGKNAAELFGMPDIDGGLVGGASLKEEFKDIVNY